MKGYIFDNSKVSVQPSDMGTYTDEQLQGLKGILFPLNIRSYGTMHSDKWINTVSMEPEFEHYGLIPQLVSMSGYDQGLGMVVPIKENTYVVVSAMWKRAEYVFTAGMLRCSFLGALGVWNTDINLDNWAEPEDGEFHRWIKNFYGKS